MSIVPMFPPTRRTVLTVVAGAATLPVVPAVAAAPSQSADPIFAAINNCKAAQRAADAAAARASAVYEEAGRRFGEGALAQHLRKAHIESVLGCDEDEYPRPQFDDLFDSHEDLFGTVPVTLPGLLAMLIFLEEIVARGNVLSDEDAYELLSTLAAAARALSKGGAA